MAKLGPRVSLAAQQNSCTLGFHPAYNAQTAIDDTAHIIVAAELTNSASYVRELPTMVEVVKDTLGANPD